jgi:Ca2+/Na+ antiporter
MMSQRAVLVPGVLLLGLLLRTGSAAEDASPWSGGGGLADAGEQRLGGDHDEHGCIPSAGYIWCETRGECLSVLAACPPGAAPTCDPELYYEAESGGCVRLTVCNATELEVVAPSASKDRVCRCSRWASWTALDMSWRIAAIVFLFCGIAVICDDYFTPALEGITEAWGLSEDVAGATFMAAGSSAPELFTSLIAVFAPHEPCAADTDSVGVATIVGSAVFNVLVIVGLSAVLGCAPGDSLELDWRPLLRDTIFYVLAILLLVVCLWDGEAWWQEALAMFGVYVCYIVFMGFNERVCYPNGRLIAVGDSVEPSDSISSGEAGVQASEEEVAGLVSDSENPQPDLEQGEDDNASSPQVDSSQHWGHGLGWVLHSTQTACDLEVPEGPFAKLQFAFMLPWTLAFKYTVPDCSRDGWEDWYMSGFFGSIVWIAVICFFMVEWSVDMAEMLKVCTRPSCINNSYALYHLAACELLGCVQMTPTIMAFTVLAAGTSIPDAMESVIVAQMGKGDMAVANSLGARACIACCIHRSLLDVSGTAQQM